MDTQSNQGQRRGHITSFQISQETYKYLCGHLDLQHLQIKLRKHVTAIKSKAKMEQLMKFK